MAQFSLDVLVEIVERKIDFAFDVLFKFLQVSKMLSREKKGTDGEHM